MRKSDEQRPTPAGKLTLTSEGLFWLGVTLLLGLVGWLKSINLVLILAYLMATLFILNGLLARLQVRRVSAAKQLLLPVLAGETTTVRVAVTNSGTRPATVSIEDSCRRGRDELARSPTLARAQPLHVPPSEFFTLAGAFPPP